MENILHLFIHVFLDSLKIVPFLFLTYLLMEWAEHRAQSISEKAVSRAGRAGPLFGALAGLFPQCGFSAAAAGLYSGGLISVGTLLAVFLSTSDEMIAVLFSGGIPVKNILIILAVKFVIAAVAGVATDILWKKSHCHDEFEHHCHEEGCHCEDNGIFLSALFHTVKIFLFIFIVSLAVHSVVEAIGEEALGRLFSGIPVLSNLIASLIGLIPNCAASVVLAQLYVEGVISAGAMISGLLTGAGAGLLVLLRINRHRSDNIKFVIILFAVGVIGGLFADALGLGGLLL